MSRYECLCCNYRTNTKHHYTQHMDTVKHHNQHGYSGHIVEDYKKRMDELLLRQEQEQEELCMSQLQKLKELDLEMRLELCKRLCQVMND